MSADEEVEETEEMAALFDARACGPKAFRCRHLVRERLVRERLVRAHLQRLGTTLGISVALGGIALVARVDYSIRTLAILRLILLVGPGGAVACLRRVSDKAGPGVSAGPDVSTNRRGEGTLSCSHSAARTRP